MMMTSPRMSNGVIVLVSREILIPLSSTLNCTPGFDCPEEIVVVR